MTKKTLKTEISNARIRAIQGNIKILQKRNIKILPKKIICGKGCEAFPLKKVVIV